MVQKLTLSSTTFVEEPFAALSAAFLAGILLDLEKICRE